MFERDIAVIRAVHSDRIRQDEMARHRAEVRHAQRRERAVPAARRAIGRSIVRIGARIAAEPTAEATRELASSR
jgi:hypothetical protein